MMPFRNLLTGHYHAYLISLLLAMLMFGIGWFYGYINTFYVSPHSKIPNFGIRTVNLFKVPNPDIPDVKSGWVSPDTDLTSSLKYLTISKYEYYGSMALFVLVFINTFLPYTRKYIVQLALVLIGILALIDFTFEYSSYVAGQLGTPITVSVTPQGYWDLIIYAFFSIIYCIICIITQEDKKYSLKAERDVDWND
jgi:hypothetical protein